MSVGVICHYHLHFVPVAITNRYELTFHRHAVQTKQHHECKHHLQQNLISFRLPSIKLKGKNLILHIMPMTIKQKFRHRRLSIRVVYSYGFWCELFLLNPQVQLLPLQLIMKLDTGYFFSASPSEILKTL